MSDSGVGGTSSDELDTGAVADDDVDGTAGEITTVSGRGLEIICACDAASGRSNVSGAEAGVLGVIGLRRSNGAAGVSV